jgi:hypothetical protein
MEIAVRGRVLTPIRVQNLNDLLNSVRGLMKAEFVRTVDIPEALVAPGTSCLALPATIVKTLNLRRRGTRKAHTGSGYAFFGLYEPVRLTVLDRDCSVDVVKVPDGCPALLGRSPLLLLDLTVDDVNGRLVGNPEHGGHPMVDLS